MAFPKYEEALLRVKNSKTPEEFNSSVENWVAGKCLDDSDFRELWSAYPPGQKLRLIWSTDKDFPPGLKRLNHEKRSEFADRLDDSEEARQDIIQVEARKAFAASLPYRLKKEPASESEAFWEEWGGGEDPEVWR